MVGLKEKLSMVTQDLRGWYVHKPIITTLGRDSVPLREPPTNTRSGLSSVESKLTSGSLRGFRPPRHHEETGRPSTTEGFYGSLYPTTGPDLGPLGRHSKRSGVGHDYGPRSVDTKWMK